MVSTRTNSNDATDLAPVPVHLPLRVVNARHKFARGVAIVIGCDDCGSAIAHALSRSGYAVAITDEADPPWPRRGMAFTNAWYIGNAELEGEAACFCASVRSIGSLLGQRLIAATTWSWTGIAAALQPELIVDARVRSDGEAVPLLEHAPLTVGIGPGFDVGVHVDLALARDTACEESCGRGDANGRVVRAPVAGRFMSTLHIGDRVRTGEVVGHIGQQPIFAPSDGVLSGLTARGARVRVGQELVEVDPRGVPALCFGLGRRPRRLAAALLGALEARGAASSPSAVASDSSGNG